MGLAFAKIGYRPIPIYNGTEEQEGSIATVDNTTIKIGLILGALELRKMNLEKNAPPAFLLDTNRLNRFKMDETVFDNSWDIYHQDLPTEKYFFKNGINKIIVIGEKVQDDLSKILYKFQERKLEIFLSNGYEEPKKVKLKKIHEKDF